MCLEGSSCVLKRLKILEAQALIKHKGSLTKLDHMKLAPHYLKFVLGLVRRRLKLKCRDNLSFLD